MSDKVRQTQSEAFGLAWDMQHKRGVIHIPYTLTSRTQPGLGMQLQAAHSIHTHDHITLTSDSSLPYRTNANVNSEHTQNKLELRLNLYFPWYSCDRNKRKIVTNSKIQWLTPFVENSCKIKRNASHVLWVLRAHRSDIYNRSNLKLLPVNVD